MSEDDEDVEGSAVGAQSGLLDVARAISSSRSLTGLLKVAALKTAQLCGVDRCSIYLRRDEQFIPAMSQFASGARDPELWTAFMEFGPCSLDDVPGWKQACLTRSPVVMDEAVATGLVPPRWAHRFKSRSVVILPLLSKDRPIGIMHLDDTLRRIGQARLGLAERISRQLAPAIDQAQATAEICRRLHEGNRLLHVAQMVGSTLDLQEVMRRIARESARAVGADTGGMYFLGEQPRELHPFVGYHVPKPILEAMQSHPLHGGDFPRLAALFRHGRRSVWSDTVPDDPDFDHEIFRQLGVQSEFITLLKPGSKVLGVLVCVWWTKRHRFTPDKVRFLERIAGLAGLALANAHRYRRAEVAGINRERARIARRLHDTLNQTMFGAAIKLDMCIHAVPPELSELRRDLEEIKRDFGLIMGQVRQLMSELGPERVVAMSLPDRLRAVIDEARALSGIHIELDEQGDAGALPPPQQEALLKTFQEALANVVKHSGASRARVRLEVLADEVRFAVTDDGIGAPAGLTVDRLAQSSAYFGLRQVRERIEALAGRLELGNAVPSGFVIQGRLPITR
ncbi:MAG TPA: GAF domain-containing protein [Methylomirabilota bacterium]|jgi:signal transduction histidine kinase|nr:GAF domain-containing protein [Methylomirabilota bacterium]